MPEQADNARAGALGHAIRLSHESRLSAARANATHRVDEFRRRHGACRAGQGQYVGAHRVEVAVRHLDEVPIAVRARERARETERVARPLVATRSSPFPESRLARDRRAAPSAGGVERARLPHRLHRAQDAAHAKRARSVGLVVASHQVIGAASHHDAPRVDHARGRRRRTTRRSQKRLPALVEGLGDDAKCGPRARWPWRRREAPESPRGARGSRP